MCNHRKNFEVEYETVSSGRAEFENGVCLSYDDSAGEMRLTWAVILKCDDCGEYLTYTKSTLPKWLKKMMLNRDEVELNKHNSDYIMPVVSNNPHSRSYIRANALKKRKKMSKEIDDVSQD